MVVYGRGGLTDAACVRDPSSECTQLRRAGEGAGMIVIAAFRALREIPLEKILVWPDRCVYFWVEGTGRPDRSGSFWKRLWEPVGELPNGHGGAGERALQWQVARRRLPFA
eukprot:4630831-Prymnesium_polylepis.1